jgi:hypothetical protein
MKYLLLIAAEKVMEDFDPEFASQHYEEYRQFTDQLGASGQLVATNRLLPADEAVTVRVRLGKVSTTDGPYAETKEQFGGYYVIEARDMNEAIQVASRIPGARYGCVEVRPIAEDEQTRQALGQSLGGVR